MENSEKPATPRALNRDGSSNVIFKDRSHSSKDWYHDLLWVPWPKFLAALIMMFVSINLFFGLIYFGLGIDGFSTLNESSRMGVFWECFFFSVQTFSTIGYGHMAPIGFSQNVAVAIEAFLGMISVAVIAGLCFSRFSRPVARLIFSQNALITTYFGKQSLVFRLANERGNQIAEATLYCVVLKDMRDGQGRFLRKQFDLKLLRKRNIFFTGSWTVIHEIDEESPFWNVTAAQMKHLNLEVVISFSGHDTIYDSGVRGRWSYLFNEILFEHEFEDMVTRTGNKLMVDLKSISNVRPLEDVRAN